MKMLVVFGLLLLGCDDGGMEPAAACESGPTSFCAGGIECVEPERPFVCRIQVNEIGGPLWKCARSESDCIASGGAVCDSDVLTCVNEDGTFVECPVTGRCAMTFCPIDVATCCPETHRVACTTNVCGESEMACENYGVSGVCLP